MYNDTKTCTKCGETKPLDGFARDRSKRDGRRPSCKACTAAYRSANSEKVKRRQREYYAANREEISRRRSERYAANCEEYRRRQNARRAANPEEYRRRERDYRAANREEDNRRSREWKAANREEVNRRNRERYAANREEVLRRTRERRAANREEVNRRRREWRAANREEVLRRERERRAANREEYNRRARERHAANTARTDEQIASDRARLRPDGLKRCRRCRERLALDDFYPDRSKPDGLQAKCRACNGRGLRTIAEPYWIARGVDPDICGWCGAPSEHVDHIKPLALGGEDIPENLIPACQPCNNRKHARPTHVWINEHVDPANEDAWLLDPEALDGATVIDPVPSAPILGPAVAFTA